MDNKKKLNILVTNDDGVNARGIQVLIELIKPFGNIVVVAPDKGQSAMSHAITLANPLFLNKIKKEDGLTVYSCSGTSVDCVKLALNEVLDYKPDFVLSGINHGSNSSISIIYSGTMAAALEGSIHGVPSIGFSILDYSDNPDFDIARMYIPKLFSSIINYKDNIGLCLNINFPSIKTNEVKGVRVCRQAKSAWVEEFDKRVDPHGRDYFWLTGKFHNFEPEALDTDDWALQNNYISVVPVNVDFTSHEVIDRIKNLEI